MITRGSQQRSVLFIRNTNNLCLNASIWVQHKTSIARLVAVERKVLRARCKLHAGRRRRHHANPIYDLVTFLMYVTTDHCSLIGNGLENIERLRCVLYRLLVEPRRFKTAKWMVGCNQQGLICQPRIIDSRPQCRKLSGGEDATHLTLYLRLEHHHIPVLCAQGLGTKVPTRASSCP